MFQLEQVTEALSGDGTSEELILLQENLQELITLTKESLDSSKPEENNDDPLAEEYALFKVRCNFVNLRTYLDYNLRINERRRNLNYLNDRKLEAY